MNNVAIFIHIFCMIFVILLAVFLPKAVLALIGCFALGWHAITLADWILK